MSEVETPESPERPKFYEWFEMQVPAELDPETTLITILTPRVGDRVEFRDPKRPENQKPKAELIRRGRIGAKIIGQKEGDCVFVNYLGVQKETKPGFSSTSSVSQGFLFDEKRGWRTLRGKVQFSVSDISKK